MHEFAWRVHVSPRWRKVAVADVGLLSINTSVPPIENVLVESVASIPWVKRRGG